MRRCEACARGMGASTCVGDVQLLDASARGGLGGWNAKGLLLRMVGVGVQSVDKLTCARKGCLIGKWPKVFESQIGTLPFGWERYESA